MSKFKDNGEGFNFYDYLNQEDMYITNANLTLYNEVITKEVPALKNLNETDILKKVLEVNKMMTDGGD